MGYSAKEFYDNEGVVDSYEATRFSGVLGRYRWRREQMSLAAMFDILPPHQTVFDCPVGAGRWAEVLIARGHFVFGADVSKAMVAAAKIRLESLKDNHLLGLGVMDAERLPLADASYDFVFSHALTKHLPNEVQERVFAEFSRIARKGIICSFSVTKGVQGALWRHRSIAEAYGLSLEDLRLLAETHGLVVEDMRRCTTHQAADVNLCLCSSTSADRILIRAFQLINDCLYAVRVRNCAETIPSKLFTPCGVTKKMFHGVRHLSGTAVCYEGRAADLKIGGDVTRVCDDGWRTRRECLKHGHWKRLVHAW